ncbi:beta-ketoacyl reductase 1 [Actinidia rufa]|uniref:Beta-ketoacyl reductase 1 n=1 Tax=Actinidia rufa TaxID=165716 RepID=A0A7J0H7K1_9ERIC|nr:beta-ketoacyl reductase 1 [Actinidia rufa]
MELCSVMEPLKSQPLWLLLLLGLGSLSLLKCSFAFLKWVYVPFPQTCQESEEIRVVGTCYRTHRWNRQGFRLPISSSRPWWLISLSGDLNEGVNRIREAIEVNVEGTTKVTQAVLPGMIKRKKGAIVNIGSGAAIVIPSDPLYAVYAAPKHTLINSQGAFMWSTRRVGSMCSVRYPCTWQQRWHQSEGPRSSFHQPIVMLGLSIIDAWRLRFCLAIRKKGQLKDSRKKE